MMKKLKITKEARKLAKRPYTRLIVYDYEYKTYWGIVPELHTRTNHDNPNKINEWIDDLILTVVAGYLEDGLDVPAPHEWRDGDFLVTCFDEKRAFWHNYNIR